MHTEPSPATQHACGQEVEVRSLRAMNRALMVQLEAVIRVGLNFDGQGFADVGELVDYLKLQLCVARERVIAFETKAADVVSQTERAERSWAVQMAWNNALDKAAIAIARAHQLRGDLYLTDACDLIESLKRRHT